MMGNKISKNDVEWISNRRDNDGIIIDTRNIEIGLNKKMVRIMLGIKPALAEYLITGDINVLGGYEHEMSENKEIFKDGTFIKIEW